MAATKPVSSSDLADIQRRMAQVRHDMHQEVHDAVKGAQSLADWQSMVKGHPWLALSIAAAAGYMIVPRRRRESPTYVAVSAPVPQQPEPSAGKIPQTHRGISKWSILGTAFSLLAPVAARAAQNYALGYLEEWLSHNPLPPTPGAAPGRSAPAGGRPARTGPGARLGE
jgi:hypothetical protein